MTLDLDGGARGDRSEHVAEPLGLSVDAGRLGHPPGRQREHGQRRAGARHRARQGPARLSALRLRRRRAGARLSASRAFCTPGADRCPFGAGVASTVGFLAAPLAFDFVRTSARPLDELDWARVNADPRRDGGGGRSRCSSGRACRAEQITHRARGRHALRRAGPRDARAAAARRRSGRTAGRDCEAFEAVYRRLYGRVGRRRRRWRRHLARRRQRSARRRSTCGERAPATRQRRDAARKATRPVYFPELERLSTRRPVYDRYRLGPGATLRRAGDRRGARIDHGRRTRGGRRRSTSLRTWIVDGRSMRS